jgi:hypothetical protein
MADGGHGCAALPVPVPVGCWPLAQGPRPTQQIIANISRCRAPSPIPSPIHTKPHAARCGSMRPGAAPCTMHRGFPLGSPYHIYQTSTHHRDERRGMTSACTEPPKKPHPPTIFVCVLCVLRFRAFLSNIRTAEHWPRPATRAAAACLLIPRNPQSSELVELAGAYFRRLSPLTLCLH